MPYGNMVPTKRLTIAESAARAAVASFTGSDKVNHYHRGVRVYLDVTLDPGTASITLTIQGKTPQGDYYTLLAGAAVAAVGNTEYTVYPGITETANVDASTPLPRVWRVIVVGADTESMTYSIYADLLP